MVSIHRPLGYEPNTLTTAPLRSTILFCKPNFNSKMQNKTDHRIACFLVFWLATARPPQQYDLIIRLSWSCLARCKTNTGIPHFHVKHSPDSHASTNFDVFLSGSLWEVLECKQSPAHNACIELSRQTRSDA